MKKFTDLELQIKSVEYRLALLKYIKIAKAGHTGGSLSCTDILNVLYNDVLDVTPESFGDKNRNRYIQSKGHSVEALYVVLADKGFYPESDLETLCKGGSKYVGHPTRKIPGIEFNTGALGHGLPISAGIALAAKKDEADYKVFTLLGDGELAEGSNWEAAQMAAHYKLDNLVAILDHNALQITGTNREVNSPYPIDEKFRAFGWHVVEVDGNNITELRKTFQAVPEVKGKPTFVIANTVKGKGVSFMENEKKWHHGVPSDEQYELAMKELNGELERLSAIKVGE
ncbi:transketolase [Maribellus sediminis]|uniref:transketolase n=1 Tax=Maribellus sediminis TaxID=2696285 RepID=UPI001431A883|nr:transketolase [Maribellus sediminis]